MLVVSETLEGSNKPMSDDGRDNNAVVVGFEDGTGASGVLDDLTPRTLLVEEDVSAK